MTIKTLEYIHKLLIEEERKTKEVYRGARRLQHEYEETSEHKDLIERQTEAADGYMHEHLAAVNALEDFESHEW
ncbi:MAG: hypothetical protein J6C91_04450 [Muribaculaceae bacterium]|nr:hypothetical protein [Muribaculaceae bacterium]